jgi:hypothetical protein
VRWTGRGSGRSCQGGWRSDEGSSEGFRWLGLFDVGSLMKSEGEEWYLGSSTYFRSKAPV